METSPLTPEEASKIAVHKTTGAQQAVELARELQLHEAIQRTAKETEAALLRGLKEVFGDGDQNQPEQMKVLVQRIPILCTSITAMHQEIEGTKAGVESIKRELAANTKATADINDNIKWGIRLVLGAVIMAVLGMVLIP